MRSLGMYFYAFSLLIRSPFSYRVSIIAQGLQSKMYIYMHAYMQVHIYILFGNRESKADRAVRDLAKIQIVPCCVSGDISHPSTGKTLGIWNPAGDNFPVSHLGQDMYSCRVCTLVTSLDGLVFNTVGSLDPCVRHPPSPLGRFGD